MNNKPIGESNVYVKHTLGVLRSQGIEINDLLERHAIDESKLDSEEPVLSQSQYSALRDELIRRYPVPGLGLLDGAGVGLSDHGLLGYAMFASSTLGKAIERHSKYQDVIGAVLHTALMVEGDIAHIRVVSVARPDMVNTDAKMQYELELLMRQWAEVGQAFGADLHWFDSVEFSYTAPEHRAMYSEILGDPVLFARPFSQINFSSRLLQQPLNFANEQTAQLCEAQCEALLAQMHQAEGLIGDIRRILANRPGQYPGIEEVAQQLALGERTLRRRLLNENTTYKQVVLDFRMELASSYLRGEEMSIQEVAYVTGYADPSNFHRTFSKYHEMTPKQYRNLHRAA